MKPTKPKKRYESEQQIVDRIDKLKKRVKSKREQAEKIDGEATALFREDENSAMKSEANKKRDKAHTLRVRCKVIEGKISTLGIKLAEFRTQPFAFVEDKSVAR